MTRAARAHTDMARVRFTLVTSRDEAAALEGSWRALYDCAEEASFFQSPDWLLPFWTHLAGDDARLLIGHDDDGRLAVLAPLCVQGGVPRTVSWLGGAPTDYLGPLIDGAVRGAADALLAELVRRFPPTRVAVTLAQMEASAPLLQATPPRDVRVEVSDQDWCPFLSLAGVRAPDEVVPSGFLARTRQLRRQAERRARLTLRLLEGDAVEHGMTQLFALHTQRWQPRGEVGSFATASLRAFYREVARRADRTRALRLLALCDGDAPMALLLAFASHGRITYYGSGFDARYAKLSPGRLVLFGLLEQALADQARELDFLRGVERYKYDWGAQDRTTKRLRLLAGDHGV